MNGELNIDLQSFVKRTYAALVYKSTMYKVLNENYIGDLRQAGSPIIEVIKSNAVSVNVRSTAEIQSALAPSLTTYGSVKVDLTELPMDYSIRIPVAVMGSNITNALQDAIDQKDSAVAKRIDTYGYGVLKGNVSNAKQWNPTNAGDTIKLLNECRATLFNNDVYDNYRIALGATEYSKYITDLTSVLKYETLQGVEGVDRGTIARAYGVDAFEVNDDYINPTVDGHAETVVGYFFNPMAVVGDAFFDAFAQHYSPQGWPGYYVLEGNILFGCKVVRGEAIIKLQSGAVSS